MDFDHFDPVYREGEYYRDNWGCLWYNTHAGLEGQVVEHPLADWSALDTYRPPDFLTKTERGERDWDQIREDLEERRRGDLPVTGSGERLFDRMYFLRGFEALMIDFATDDPHLPKLIDMLLEYEMGLVQKWLELGVDVMGFHTDIGTQKALMISPDMFRRYLKPMFKTLFMTCRDAGVHVLLSSDGHLLEIVDDLIECGVSMHDPQVRANTLEGIDAVLYLVEPENVIGPGDRYIIDMLQGTSTPVILGMNKIDLIPQREKLLPIIETYSQAYDFAEIIPLSARENENIEHTIESLIKYLPEGPQYYPEEMVTDQPERFIVAELIREKVLHLTREEIPYSIAVVVEQMKSREGKDIIDIEATVYVERDSQKGIIIGKSGTMLKRIGTLARKDMENILGNKVFLNIWVKVRKNWRMNEQSLRMFGYTNP